MRLPFGSLFRWNNVFSHLIILPRGSSSETYSRLLLRERTAYATCSLASLDMAKQIIAADMVNKVRKPCLQLYGKSAFRLMTIFAISQPTRGDPLPVDLEMK